MVKKLILSLLLILFILGLSAVSYAVKCDWHVGPNVADCGDLETQADCVNAYYGTSPNYKECLWSPDFLECYGSDFDCCGNAHIDTLGEIEEKCDPNADPTGCEDDEVCAADCQACIGFESTTTTSEPGAPEFTGYAGILIALIVVAAIAFLLVKKKK